MVGEGWAIETPAGYQPRGWGGLADGEPRAQDGTTPLTYAVSEGHEVIVGAFLKAGADKDAKDEVRRGGLKTLQTIFQNLLSDHRQSLNPALSQPKTPDILNFHP